MKIVSALVLSLILFSTLVLAGSRTMMFEELYHPAKTSGGQLFRVEFNRQTISPTSPLDVPDTNVTDTAFASSGINYWDARVPNSYIYYNIDASNYYDGVNYWYDGTNYWDYINHIWVVAGAGVGSGYIHVYRPTTNTYTPLLSYSYDCYGLYRTKDGVQTSVNIVFSNLWTSSGVWNEGGNPDYRGDPLWLTDDGFLMTGTQNYIITGLTPGANAKLVFYNVSSWWSAGNDRTYTATANGVGPVRVVSSNGVPRNAIGGQLLTGIVVDGSGKITGQLVGVGNTGGEIFLTGMQIWTDK